VAIRVLLVDDVPEVRRLVRTALRFRGLFTVIGEAADGTGAIELAREGQPDVVVLDIGLPDLAGREVITAIRAVAPAVKVVVFSGTDPRDIEGIVEHVEGYALKDSQLDYLVDLLETVGRSRTDTRTLELPADLTSAREARTFAAVVLEGWRLPHLVDDATLVVSEMVTNAVTHAGSGCELRLSVSPLALRIEVADYGPGTPDPKPPSTTRNSGRGLHLIDALTAAWGVEPTTDAGGKTVWAELLRPS
jgi:CheY-like chemotaxis protein